MAIKAGQKLGLYEVLALVGAGGKGEVYKAFKVRVNFYAPVLSTLFYSVSKDGQRFLISQVESSSEPVLNVVVNWQQSLQSAK